MKIIVLIFLILILATACQSNYIPVNKCPVVQDIEVETVEDLIISRTVYKSAYERCNQ